MNTRQLTEMRQYFESQGITQKTIAERLQVSPAYVNKLFLGKKDFGKKTAEKFRDLFGLSQSWLLTGEGPMLSPVPDDSAASVSSIVNGPHGTQAVGDGARAVNGEGAGKCLEKSLEIIREQQETIRRQAETINRLVEKLG